MFESATGLLAFHRGLARIGVHRAPVMASRAWRRSPGTGASPAMASSALATCSLMPRNARRARPTLCWQHMTVAPALRGRADGPAPGEDAPVRDILPGVLPPPLIDQVGISGIFE